MSYILDTCIINWLVDGCIHSEDMPSEGKFFATHIQIDELKKTKDKERRDRLLQKFSEIKPKIIHTESFILDISRLGEARLSNGNLYGKLKFALDELKPKPNNMHDALIAEVAIANGLILLTSDKNLSTVTKDHGGVACLFSKISY